MPEGLTELEKKINLFQDLLAEMKEETREAHSVLKQIRAERKEINKYLETQTKSLINDRVDSILREEIESIGKVFEKQSNLIYEKVGNQIDKLINICLGKEYSQKEGTKDLRPILAAKLREFMMETINEEE
jgi:GTPase involved in cell partitioning and DNA repair